MKAAVVGARHAGGGGGASGRADQAMADYWIENDGPEKKMVRRATWAGHRWSASLSNGRHGVHGAVHQESSVAAPGRNGFVQKGLT